MVVLGAKCLHRRNVVEDILKNIEENARYRENTLRRATDFLNDLNTTLYEKRIGRRVEIPIESTQVVAFGWGRVVVG